MKIPLRTSRGGFLFFRPHFYSDVTVFQYNKYGILLYSLETVYH